MTYDLNRISKLLRNLLKRVCKLFVINKCCYVNLKLMDLTRH